MKKNNKNKDLNSILNELALSWFSDNLSQKIEKLKQDFIELSNGTSTVSNPYAPDLSSMEISPKSIDAVYKKIQEVTSKWKSIEEIIDFANKNNNLMEVSKLFADADSTSQFDALQGLIGEKIDFGDLVVKVQVETIMRLLAESLDVVENVISKLGPETEINNIDEEDLDYVLNMSIKDSTDKFEKWINRNYFELENFKTEFSILTDEKNSFESRLEASDVIGLFFKQYKIKEIAQDIEAIDVTSDSAISQNTAQKFINFTNGSQISSDITNRLNIAIMIKENIKK